MDEQIKIGQQWLNTTYEKADGWVRVEPDGHTGWNTMFALRRGLQYELGISPLGSGFGPATTAAFTSKVGRLSRSSAEGNLIRLLSVALWCKGYPGLFAQDAPKFSSLESSVLAILDDLGLPHNSIDVDVKLMKSLLSMDAYVKVRGGKDRIRDIQRWLNGTYHSRADFEIVPCEGVYSRQVQTAMLFALQYELGMADGVANGNFGPGTRKGLREKANEGLGSSGNATRIFQAALNANNEDCPFTGTFDDVTAQATRRFQQFLELDQTGLGDYGTWCALLVSTGDANRSTKAFDTARSLSPAAAKTTYGQGYQAVGRYLVGGGKYLRPHEMEALRDSGLHLIPIFQRFARDVTDFTKEQGTIHAEEAFTRARLLQIPTGSMLIFAVDVDLTGEDIAGPLSEYFSGIKKYAEQYLVDSYRIGVYGTRNVCATLMDKGLTEGSYVAGMSSGWSGNMGFAMPKNWMYNQIAEIESGIDGVGTLDKVAISSRATPVAAAKLVRVPTAAEPTDTSLLFDEFYELVVRAEMELTSRIPPQGVGDPHSLPASSYRAALPDTIAHWLRKPKYWSGGNLGLLWQAYTPVTDVTGLGTWIELMGKPLSEKFGDLSERYKKWEAAFSLDAQHLAATFLGYQRWSVPQDPGSLSVGDFGGWIFDLLSVWGDAERAGKNNEADIEGFTHNTVGGDSTKGSFSYSDLVADAAGFLLCVWLKEAPGTTLGYQMARLRKLSNREVLKQFLDTRFGGDPKQCEIAFDHFSNLITNTLVKIVTIVNIKKAANSDTLPDGAVCKAIGRGFSTKLSELV